MTSHWDLIKQGDKRAFIEIYESTYQDLYIYGLKIAGNKELVKDCIQQIFLEIWSKKENLSQVRLMRPYLMKYLKRHLVRQIRLQHQFVPYKQEGVETVYPYEYLIIEHQSSEVLRSKLRLAMQQLSSKQLKVITMKFMEGLTYEEIAEVTGTKPRTIYNQVHEALKKLKQAIGISLLMVFL